MDNKAIIDLFDTHDGSHTVFSENFGFTYHSKFGAVTESKHVYIDAGLRFKAVRKTKINILEVGLGTGLNAYMTFLESLRRNLTVSYVGVEAYPVDIAIAKSLNFIEHLDNQGFENIFDQIHEVEWNKTNKLHPQFSLHKSLTLIEDFEIENEFDLIYFDAFAPRAQPHLWSSQIMKKMYRALKKDGILVTYCAKGDAKRAMKSAGFIVEKIPGPPGKREMTRAMK